MIEIIFYVLRQGIKNKNAEEITAFINDTLEKFHFIHLPDWIIPNLFQHPKSLKSYSRLLKANDNGTYNIEANCMVTPELFQSKIISFARGFKYFKNELETTGRSRIIYLKGAIQNRGFKGELPFKILLHSMVRLKIAFCNENKTSVELNASKDAQFLFNAMNSLIENVLASKNIGYGDQFYGEEIFDPLHKELFLFLTGHIQPTEFSESPKIETEVLFYKKSIEQLNSEKEELKTKESNKEKVREKVYEIENEKRAIQLQNNPEPSFEPTNLEEAISTFEKGFYKSLIYNKIPNSNTINLLDDEAETDLYNAVKLYGLNQVDIKRALMMVKDPELTKVDDWEIIYKCFGVSDFRDENVNFSVLEYLKFKTNPSDSIINLLDAKTNFKVFDSHCEFKEIIEEVCRNNVVTQVEENYLIEKAKAYNVDLNTVKKFIARDFTGHNTFKLLLNEVAADGKITQSERDYVNEKAEEYNFSSEETENMLQDALLKSNLAKSSIETSLNEVWDRLFFLEAYDLSRATIKKIKHDIHMFFLKENNALPNDEEVALMINEIDEVISQDIIAMYKLPVQDFHFNFKILNSFTKHIKVKVNNQLRNTAPKQTISDEKVLSVYEEMLMELSYNDKNILHDFIKKLGVDTKTIS
tara:strand:- start:882 stop:2807 length:1926 start_codon:yes stop_codon:yes gene_type:complete